MRNRFLAALLTLATLAVPAARVAAAPEGHYSWITPVAGWSEFSHRIGYPADSLKAGPIFGLRLGRQFRDDWGLELAGAFAKTKEAAYPDRDVTYYDVSGNLMFEPGHWKAGELYLAQTVSPDGASPLVPGSVSTAVSGVAAKTLVNATSREFSKATFAP